MIVEVQCFVNMIHISGPFKIRHTVIALANRQLGTNTLKAANQRGFDLGMGLLLSVAAGAPL